MTFKEVKEELLALAAFDRLHSLQAKSSEAAYINGATGSYDVQE